MTEYTFTKASTSVTRSYKMIFKTKDLRLLKLMDAEVDKLINQYYESKNND